jgi:RNA polymerase sigma factor (sigma-70 family)
MTNLELYNQYRQTLSNLFKAKRKYQNQKDTRSVRIVNSMIRDVHDVIYDIEAYLPLKQRKYTLRRIRRYQQYIEDRRNLEGIVPNEKPPIIKAPHEIIYDVDFKQVLHSTIESICNDDQKYLLSAYFMYDMTQDKIAKKLGISQSRVSQQIREIILKIRNSTLFFAYISQKH